MPRQGQSNNGKAPVHEFLPDNRVEQVWDRLNKELDLPEDTQFATVVQPAHWMEHPDTGLTVLQPEMVLFWTIVPNPQKRWAGRLVKQYAALTMEDWRQMEMENKHYAGAPDPAYVIFRAACLKLIQSYKYWRELN